MSKIIPREKLVIETRKGKTLTVEVAVLRRYIRCQGCFEDLRSRPFHLDHIIPLEMGGSDEVANLAPLCVPCHAKKTKLDVADIARAKRLAGETCTGPSRTPMPYGKSSTFKRKLSGKVVLR